MDINFDDKDIEEDVEENKSQSQTQTKIVFKNPMKTVCDITDEELELLYVSFDIDLNQINRKFSLWRLEVIHIRGVQNMSSEDVLKYFEEFDPNSIEWVNDLSCNVVFNDQKASAVAMKGLTTAVVLKTNKQQFNSDIDIPVIDFDSLSVPIPPQFRWRLGKTHNKSKALLLRFATNNDKKVLGARLISQYYAENGFPSDNTHKSPDKTQVIDRKRRYNSDDIHEDSHLEATDSDSEIKSKRFRMRMRADDEQQLIRNRRTAKMRTNDLKSKSIWDRLDNDSFGNYCAVDTDLIEIAFDNRTNSRTTVWKERPLRSSIIATNRITGFDKNDLRTKLKSKSKDK